MFDASDTNPSGGETPIFSQEGSSSDVGVKKSTQPEPRKDIAYVIQEGWEKGSQPRDTFTADNIMPSDITETVRSLVKKGNLTLWESSDNGQLSRLEISNTKGHVEGIATQIGDLIQEHIE